MPLYTPLSGSWLNMCESIQRIIKRCALGCQHKETPEEIISGLEAMVREWNREPTPFEWGGEANRTAGTESSTTTRLRREWGMYAASD